MSECRSGSTVRNALQNLSNFFSPLLLQSLGCEVSRSGTCSMKGGCKDGCGVESAEQVVEVGDAGPSDGGHRP